MNKKNDLKSSSPTSDPATMVVNAAYQYLMKVSLSSGKFSNFRLEEIRTDEQGDYFLTLSYDAVGEFAFDKTREYKDFKVKPNGTVEWMKIRKI